MTDGQPGIHGRVLDNLLDGVMVVERGGVVSVFNEAAGRILGLAPADVVGRSFAEHFIAREGFEEFSELILGAVAGEIATAQSRKQFEAVGTDILSIEKSDRVERTATGQGPEIGLEGALDLADTLPTVVGLFFGFQPAYQASRLDPIVALQGE